MIRINTNPSPKDLRLFGMLWFPLFCGVLGAVLRFRFELLTASVVVWALAVPSLLLGLAVPTWVRPIFLGMSYLTFPIGWVVSQVVLVLVYSLVLTPFGIALRLFGHDPMRRALDEKLETYWEPRQSTTEIERYFRQY